MSIERIDLSGYERIERLRVPTARSGGRSDLAICPIVVRRSQRSASGFEAVPREMAVCVPSKSLFERITRHAVKETVRGPRGLLHYVFSRESGVEHHADFLLYVGKEHEAEDFEVVFIRQFLNPDPELREVTDPQNLNIRLIEPFMTKLLYPKVFSLKQTRTFKELDSWLGSQLGRTSEKDVLGWHNRKNAEEFHRVADWVAALGRSLEPRLRADPALRDEYQRVADLFTLCYRAYAGDQVSEDQIRRHNRKALLLKLQRLLRAAQDAPAPPGFARVA